MQEFILMMWVYVLTKKYVYGEVILLVFLYALVQSNILPQSLMAILRFFSENVVYWVFQKDCPSAMFLYVLKYILCKFGDLIRI